MIKIFSVRLFTDKDQPRKSLPSRAIVHVSAASYKDARSSVMLYFFFSFFDTMYMAAAPAYFTANFSVRLKLPAWKDVDVVYLKFASNVRIWN